MQIEEASIIKGLLDAAQHLLLYEADDKVHDGVALQQCVYGIGDLVNYGHTALDRIRGGHDELLHLGLHHINLVKYPLNLVVNPPCQVPFRQLGQELWWDAVQE